MGQLETRHQCDMKLTCGLSCRRLRARHKLKSVTDSTGPLEAFVDVLAQRVADEVLARLDEREALQVAEKTTPSNALRMDEAGRRLGLSEREVQRQVLKGTLRSVKVGRVRLIPLSALDEFLERQRAS